MRLALLLLCLAWPAQALELRLQTFYDLNRPASLAFDPAFCGLWIANEGPEAVLVTLEGEELRRFRSELPVIKAIALEGNQLVVGDGYGRHQRLTKDGTPLGAPFQLQDTFIDTEGIVMLPDGTLVMVEDDPARLLWVAPDGAVLRQLDTGRFDPPLIEPQGIARDPRNGHLLVVDDQEGTNSLFELDPEGRVLATASLRDFGWDPEGIALRPSTGTLFVAFDQGARIAALDYTPTTPLPPASGAVAADCALF